MRYVKLVILGAMIFVVSCIWPADKGWGGEGKIGYIDVSKIFDEYKKTQDSEAILEKATKKKQTQRDKMVSDIRRLKDELELLSEEGKLKKQTLIDKKVEKLRDFDQKTRQDLGGKREEMIAQILKEIDKLIQEYGKSEGYDLILNDKVLIYKTEALDITEEILKTLNVGYEKR